MRRRLVLGTAVVAVVVLGVGAAGLVSHVVGGGGGGKSKGVIPGAAGGAGGSGESAPVASNLHWTACTSSDLKTAGAVCAMVPVPLDYSRPAGTKIQIAVSMVKHTSSSGDYQGVMLANPGGPGQSGLGLATSGKNVPGGVGADYDWIGFDPRGVGSSVPALRCEPTYFTGPRMAYVPADAAQTTKWLQRAAGYSAACAKKGGALLDHLTTSDSAMDLDSIRKALGQKQINFYGYSYGTYLGQVYATLFPTHVRRMVLDSNVDPRAVWYQGNLDQDTAFERNLKIWFAWVGSNNATYHLGSSESAVERLFYTTEKQLQAHPAGQVGGDEWGDIFMYAGYLQRFWPDLGQTFADWVHNHNSAQISSLYQGLDNPTDDNSYAMYVAVQCTDTAWPRSVAQNLADSRRVYRSARFITWENQWFNAPCLTWPAAPHTPVKVDGSKVASALLVDETLDAATPYAGSLEVRQLFPHSALLALPGGTSHANSLQGDTCEDDLISRYLATGALPARQPGNRADATCAPLPVPSPTG